MPEPDPEPEPEPDPDPEPDPEPEPEPDPEPEPEPVETILNVRSRINNISANADVTFWREEFSGWNSCTISGYVFPYCEPEYTWTEYSTAQTPHQIKTSSNIERYIEAEGEHSGANFSRWNDCDNNSYPINGASNDVCYTYVSADGTQTVTARYEDNASDLTLEKNISSKTTFFGKGGVVTNETGQNGGIQLTCDNDSSSCRTATDSFTQSEVGVVATP
ncbi:MAG: hypothetical protein U5L75_03435 [Candidatus Campbellbacteria bacterium]|nr:hypothetical protein [Candidatus Campbellbacteria bacterium]